MAGCTSESMIHASMWDFLMGFSLYITHLCLSVPPSLRLCVEFNTWDVFSFSAEISQSQAYWFSMWTYIGRVFILQNSKTVQLFTQHACVWLTQSRSAFCSSHSMNTLCNRAAHWCVYNRFWRTVAQMNNIIKALARQRSTCLWDISRRTLLTRHLWIQADYYRPHIWREH